MTKELAVKQEEATFMVLSAAAAPALAALKSNMEGETLSPQDLDRVKVPAGGSTTWCIPTLEGDENTPEIVGVIALIQNTRAYWPGEYSGAGDPPSCVSDDGFTGIGDPGGNCKNCPFDQFGSDNKGKGKACREQKRVFLVRPTSLLPVMVSLPVMSLKGAKGYLMRLGSQGLQYQEVVSRITLAKDKNTDGIVYSRAVFALVGKLDPAQSEAMRAYVKDMGPLLKRPVIADDFHG